MIKTVYQSTWKNRVYISLKRPCAPMTDKLISVNDPTGRVALAHSIGRPEQHATIFSGMELDRFLDVGSALSVPPLDIATLAARVVQLLRDDEMRTKLGSAGSAFAADHFGLRTMVDRISDVYFKALAIPSSGAASGV